MQESDKSTRFAGYAIAVSFLVLVINITLYATFLGKVPAANKSTGPMPVERAAHLTEHWGALSAMWFVEIALYALLAVAAFVLAAKSSGGVSWCPRRAAWTAVAVGAISQVAMYAFMLGGYAAAIPVVATEPGLLDAMYRSAMVLFFTGNIAVLFGFGAAFSAEANQSTVLGCRVARVGAIVCIGVAMLMLVVAATALPFLAAAPPALIAHVLMAYLGLRIGSCANQTSVA